MGSPDSLERWAVTGLLILALCALAAICVLWAEDVRAMRTVPRGWPHIAATYRAVRGLPAACRRTWLAACCRAAELRFLLTTLIGAHR